MRRLFLVNPAARGAPPDLAERIRARFPDARVLFTRGPGDAELLAAEAVAGVDPPDVVVACGGDGTLREAAQGAGSRALLGLVPVGTVNQVAAELGIPGNLTGALETLVTGGPREVYPGGCRFDGQDPPRLFFIGVSVGPDADAVHRLSPMLKRRAGRYAYVASFLGSLGGLRRDAVTCAADGRRWSATQAVAAKTAHYGGSMRFSRDLSLFAPGLDVATVSGGGLAVAGFFLRALLRLEPRGALRVASGAALTLSLPAAGNFQIDGDAVTATRAELSPCAQPLRVIAGKAAAP